MKPSFTFCPTNPADDERTRFEVYAGEPEVDGAYLGIVYQTADGSWVADWSRRNDAPAIAAPGFASKAHAASVLYWFAPPAQSTRSRPAGHLVPVPQELEVDLSQCGCCLASGCECEGTNRTSLRFGTTQSYQVHPSLLPAPGGLVSLLPMRGGAFLVDLNTRGCGSGIGYLRQLDDGRYELRLGGKPVGRASSPEVGMWMCLKLHTNTKIYDRLTEAFEQYEDAPAAGAAETAAQGPRGLEPRS
ncbi:hypothetical protein [Streptomyces lydicus]|uniref:hypothetical protein n=1 Tax=Streptomyces lydicus TaxID=47763 RepID=UPI0036E21B7B